MKWSILETIEFIKRNIDNLAPPIDMGDLPPMVFTCEFFHPQPIAAYATLEGFEIPTDLRQFWSTTMSANLFIDKNYGQWGLHLLDLESSLKFTEQFKDQRASDYKTGDLIIGQFLGDSDVLVIRCDENSDDYGEIVVALPLDSRKDWYRVSSSFGEFLKQYATSGGQKFWSKTSE